MLETAATKNTNAESKEIAVKGYKKEFAKVPSRNKSEELAAESNKLEAPPSPPQRTLKTTTLKTHITIIIKNKPAESKMIAVEFTNKQV